MPRAQILLDQPARILTPAATEWPAQLADLKDPPEQLWIAGQLPRLTRVVAIVGTRFVDEDSRSFARELAWHLAGAGWVVVSGGAAGIDGAAHQGALDAGGPTIAVLATGLKDAFPAEHAGLFGAIARCGALLSEERERIPSRRGWIFLNRNRVVAALASVVVVVQAPVRSGALSTARWAKLLKRRVFVVPAAPWDPRGAGCLELLAAGAEICTSAADILSLGRSGPNPVRLPVDDSYQDPNDHEGLPASVRALLHWLRSRPGHPDQISVALDMPAGEVQEALLTLMLRGLCRQRVDGTYEAVAV